MNSASATPSGQDVGWAAMVPGTPVGPASMHLSPAANERYWSSAGVDHATLRAGVAYPLVAANATVLAWLATCSEPMIQTRQRLRCHRLESTPTDLVTAGSVTAKGARRGREHILVQVEVATGDGLLWTSEVGFTPVATVARPAAHDHARVSRAEAPAPLDVPGRSMTITDDAIVQYSRRGNYHSDSETAAALGLGGLLAQGTQVSGPAYATLLEAWGEEFLASGNLEMRFVAMVYGGETVAAYVEFGESRRTGARTASLQVWNATRDRLAVVGEASVPV